MKKYLLFLLAFIPVLMFNSCSSDDDNPTVNSQILGTWVNTNDIEVVVTTFNSNGTVTEISTLKLNGAKREYVGTFSTNNDKLNINWQKYRDYNSVSKEWSDYKNDSETVVITYTIKADQLIFLSMEGEEQNSPVYHTRK